MPPESVLEVDSSTASPLVDGSSVGQAGEAVSVEALGVDVAIFLKLKSPNTS